VQARSITRTPSGLAVFGVTAVQVARLCSRSILTAPTQGEVGGSDSRAAGAVR